MALLERVATLLRANMNDLIDRAEDPEKLIKQVILDIENQLLQVKTQVAIVIADQHMLEKKRSEHADKAAGWMRRAEFAVDQQHDDLARAALGRAMSYRRLAESFTQQATDQTAQVDTLKSALQELEQKLAETRAQSDLLIARHRRSRALRQASAARGVVGERSRRRDFERLQERVVHEEAVSTAVAHLTAASLDDRFAALEGQDEIERLLADIKARRVHGPSTGGVQT
jgi:phage shock protein A